MLPAKRQIQISYINDPLMLMLFNARVKRTTRHELQVLNSMVASLAKSIIQFNDVLLPTSNNDFANVIMSIKCIAFKMEHACVAISSSYLFFVLL